VPLPASDGSRGVLAISPSAGPAFRYVPRMRGGQIVGDLQRLDPHLPRGQPLTLRNVVHA
jgi:hypothetical protein